MKRYNNGVNEYGFATMGESADGQYVNAEVAERLLVELKDLLRDAQLSQGQRSCLEEVIAYADNN